MDYVGTIIRPPSEAHSIILQVTVGCSHNKCTFCGAYKDKTFRFKEDCTITADLQFARTYCQRQKKVFLADGDALIIPHHRLLQIFQEIRTNLPQVNRISLYGSARSIRSKSIEQLSELKSMGLDRVYLGLESGCDEILRRVNKGETAKSMIAAAERVGAAKLFLSVTVLLGLGEVTDSRRHAELTAAVLNKMAPKQVAALTLIPLANTTVGQLHAQGEFILPEPNGLLRELRIIVERLDIPTQFHANHASNYLPIMGRIPRDTQYILDSIDLAIQGETTLVPDSMRRL